MPFLIYANLDDDEKHYDFDESLRAQGIIGTVTTQKSPVAEASTREQAIERAYSLLGQHPTESYYAVDAEGNLLESAFVTEIGELRSRSKYWQFQAVFMFVIGAFCIALTAANPNMAWKGIQLFFLLTSIEFVISRTYNFVEGAVTFFIIAMLILSVFGTANQPPKKNLVTPTPAPTAIPANPVH